MPARQVALEPGADLVAFRNAVRSLIAEGVPPAEVSWSTAQAPGLFANDAAEAAPLPASPLALPRSLAALIETVVCHSDHERYALLYDLIWRVTHGERAVLENAADRVVHRLQRMRGEVDREIHRMHAFLRFRRTDRTGAERYVAWFEPAHFILEAAAPFFVDRFPGMAWSILTPIGSMHWDGDQLVVGPAAKRSDALDADPYEAGWRGYYESIFNPARLNPRTMRGHMPERYWRNMPEAQSIAGLVRSAPARVVEMIQREAEMPTRRDPAKAVRAMARQHPRDLDELNRIIRDSAPMVVGSERAVLGEGPIGAAIAFVGEQPGDQEDLQGRPFVGPAGQLFDRALDAAGIARDSCYVTNAVKHFKFAQRGKRRLHQKPTAGEVTHYRWWLDLELGFVAPRLVVALGASAVLALTGKPLPVTKVRGPLRFGDRDGYVTVHPSYLLRLPDAAEKLRAFTAFVDDLTRAREIAASPSPA